MMKSAWSISLVQITLCLLGTLTSCGQSQSSKPTEEMANQHPQPIQIDTEKTTVIPFAPATMKYLFSNDYKPVVLNQSDINAIETLLITGVADYNKSLTSDRTYREIDLNKHNYRKQLMAVINAKGEKEVWVNCFCDTWGSDKWKREIMMVTDGGSCYFNVKLNLTTKKVYDLLVNGEA